MKGNQCYKCNGYGCNYKWIINSSKNYKWLWISVDRNSGEYVDFVLGNRGSETGKILWNRVEEFAKGMVYADFR
jgi:IS1 family transposase